MIKRIFLGLLAPAAQPGMAGPFKATPADHGSCGLVNRTLRALSRGTMVASGPMIAATDPRHFGDAADPIDKFAPVRAWLEDLPRFHGDIERIALANRAERIRFHRRLVEQAAA